MGLMLDKSKGLSLGNELAPPNLLGWGVYGTPSNITTTSFKAASAGNGLRLTGLVVGKVYKVTASGSGNCTLVAENVGTIYSPTIGDCIFTATATSLVLRATTVGTVTVERFSLKLLVGNHAYQTVSAMRPLLVAVPQRLDYDAVDDKLTTTLPTLLTGCTIIRSVPNVGTQILTGQTIPVTYVDNKDHCSLIVINRVLTPSETSAITSEFNKRAGV